MKVKFWPPDDDDDLKCVRWMRMRGVPPPRPLSLLSSHPTILSDGGQASRVGMLVEEGRDEGLLVEVGVEDVHVEVGMVVPASSAVLRSSPPDRNPRGGLAWVGGRRGRRGRGAGGGGGGIGGRPAGHPVGRLGRWREEGGGRGSRPTSRRRRAGASPLPLGGGRIGVGRDDGGHVIGVDVAVGRGRSLHHVEVGGSGRGGGGGRNGGREGGVAAAGLGLGGGRVVGLVEVTSIGQPVQCIGLVQELVDVLAGRVPLGGVLVIEPDLGDARGTDLPSQVGRAGGVGRRRCRPGRDDGVGPGPAGHLVHLLLLRTSVGGGGEEAEQAVLEGSSRDGPHVRGDAGDGRGGLLACSCSSSAVALPPQVGGVVEVHPDLAWGGEGIVRVGEEGVEGGADA